MLSWRKNTFRRETKDGCLSSNAVLSRSSWTQWISLVIVWFEFKSSKWTNPFMSHQTDSNTLRRWRPLLAWGAGTFSFPTHCLRRLTVFVQSPFLVKLLFVPKEIHSWQQRRAHIRPLSVVRTRKFVRNPLPQLTDFFDEWLNDQIQVSRIVPEQLRWDIVPLRSSTRLLLYAVVSRSKFLTLVLSYAYYSIPIYCINIPRIFRCAMEIIRQNMSNTLLCYFHYNSSKLEPD